MRLRIPRLALAATAVVIVGCSTTGTRGTHLPTPGPKDPKILVDAPPSGTTVLRGAHNVLVEVHNFKLVDKIGDPPAKGEGHLIFYLDVARVPTDPTRPATTAEGTWHATADSFYLWPHLKPGKHRILMQLVNNDNTPLTPPVLNAITFTVSRERYIPPSPTGSPTG